MSYQEIQIDSQLGSATLRLRTDITSGTIAIRVATPTYNATAYVRPEQLLIAARTLCEAPPAPVQKGN